MTKIVASAILLKLIMVMGFYAYEEEVKAYNICLENHSRDTCITNMAGG